jgi:hypothetical protein
MGDDHENRALIIVSPITVIGPGLMSPGSWLGSTCSPGAARMLGRTVKLVERPAPSPDLVSRGPQRHHHHDDGWPGVVDAVSFTIARVRRLSVGERCGKSTVAYHLLGYRRPGSRVDSGRIMFQGVDLLRLGRPALDTLRGNRISLVPQNPTTALSPGMRVGEQIAEVLRSRS